MYTLSIIHTKRRAKYDKQITFNTKDELREYIYANWEQTADYWINIDPKLPSFELRDFPYFL